MNERKKHDTCAEVTNHGDLILGKQAWMCTEACLDAPEAKNAPHGTCTEVPRKLGHPAGERRWVCTVECGIEAERRRIRTALAGAVLEALRALPEGQAIVHGRIVDGPLTAARLRAAWRESFPLTDEVAQHLREVLAGEVNP